jgi:sugar phosphate permease
VDTKGNPIRDRLTRLVRKRRTVFYGWWIVATSHVFQILTGGLYGTGLAVYFLPISRDLDLSRAALSFAFTLRSLESGLDGPLTGYLVDRLGPRVMMRGGVIVAAAGFILLAFTHSYGTFLLVFLGLLAVGFSAGVHHPVMVLINQWFSRRRALAMNLGYVGNEVGGALLTPLVAVLVLNAGWRPAAVLSGLLILLTLVPLSFLIRNNPESMGLLPDGDGKEASSKGAARQRPRRGSDVPTRDFTVREALRTSALWQLSAALGARVFGKSLLHIHLVPLMVWKGIDEQTAALLVGLFAFCQIPLRIGAGLLGDRWSINRVPALTMLVGVATVSVLLWGTPGSVWTGVLFVVLFALAESGNTVSWAIVGDFFGRRNFGTIRGAVSFIHMPLSLPAPTIGGLVFDRTGSYSRALLPALAFYLLASLLYWTLRRPRTPSKPQPVAAATEQTPAP